VTKVDPGVPSGGAIPVRTRRLSVAATQGVFMPALRRPQDWIVSLDFDGTASPFVINPERASIGQQTRQFLSRLPGLFGQVQFISGRPADLLHEKVGIDDLHYFGVYGAEVRLPGQSRAVLGPQFAPYIDPLHEFATREWETSLRRLGVRIEDKEVMVVFHWRGLPNAEEAERAVNEVAERARRVELRSPSGETAHWQTVPGEMNVEIRPPVPLTKKDAFIRSASGRHWGGAIIFGDEATDLQTLDGAQELREAGAVGHALFVGVRSDHTPVEMERRADLMVAGVRGVTRALSHLATARAVA
jgi:trehalose-phosphatase